MLLLHIIIVCVCAAILWQFPIQNNTFFRETSWDTFLSPSTNQFSLCFWSITCFSNLVNQKQQKTVYKASFPPKETRILFLLFSFIESHHITYFFTKKLWGKTKRTKHELLFWPHLTTPVSLNSLKSLNLYGWYTPQFWALSDKRSCGYSAIVMVLRPKTT